MIAGKNCGWNYGEKIGLQRDAKSMWWDKSVKIFINMFTTPYPTVFLLQNTEDVRKKVVFYLL
jgi:hypothetical protein